MMLMVKLPGIPACRSRPSTPSHYRVTTPAAAVPPVSVKNKPLNGADQYKKETTKEEVESGHSFPSVSEIVAA